MVMNKPRLKTAFTIMEIMVVVIILGVIAGFAIPNFSKSIERTHMTDAINQLQAIHSADQIYFARTRAYWPATAVNDVTAINTALSTNIIENGMAYNCSGDGTSFTCTATRTGSTFVVTVTEAPLSDTNPACTGACPG